MITKEYWFSTKETAGTQHYLGPPVPNGGEYGYALRCMRRGVIKKLNVVALDTGADLTGFYYELYNTAEACPVGANPSSSRGPKALGPSAIVFLVVPRLVVASAKNDYVSSEGFPEDGSYGGLSIPFECQDQRGGGTLNIDPTSPGDTLYLLINSSVGGASVKHFGVALTVQDPII